MSEIYLRPNLVDPNLSGLRGTRFIETPCNQSTSVPCLKGSMHYSVVVLGCLLFWSMGVMTVEGKITSPSQPNTLVEPNPDHNDSRHHKENRRNPFKPIKKRIPIPAGSKKNLLDSTMVPKVENPVWKLLGVFHGQSGRQAVIQLSPKERVVVQSGSELARSGWTIKAITESEVLLERRSSTSSTGVSSPPGSFILSFPVIRKSP